MAGVEPDGPVPRDYSMVGPVWCRSNRDCRGHPGDHCPGHPDGPAPAFTPNWNDPSSRRYFVIFNLITRYIIVSPARRSSRCIKANQGKSSLLPRSLLHPPGRSSPHHIPPAVPRRVIFSPLTSTLLAPPLSREIKADQGKSSLVTVIDAMSCLVPFPLARICLPRTAGAC